MKDWLKKWLGIRDAEVSIIMLEIRLRKLNKRIGRLDSKPLRYDEVQRATKRMRKISLRTGTPY